MSLYREHFVKTASGWIPDRLTEVERLPDFGVMPDPDDGIEGQNTRVYLVDLWIPPNADVARFRLEVQVKMANWTVRPMEVRVMEARFPDVQAGADNPLPPLEWGAEAPAARVLSEYMAGGKIEMRPQGQTLRGILRRNAAQDVALGGQSLWARALDLFRANLTFWPRPYGAEWWLRLRDRMYAGR